MATVSISNPHKEVFVFTLYHSVYCANGGPCACDKQNILRPVDGGLRYTDILSPVGVFLEGGTSQEFDTAVLQIQQIESAIKSGRLTQAKVIENVTAPKTDELPLEEA